MNLKRGIQFFQIRLLKKMILKIILLMKINDLMQIKIRIILIKKIIYNFHHQIIKYNKIHFLEESEFSKIIRIKIIYP